MVDAQRTGSDNHILRALWVARLPHAPEQTLRGLIGTGQYRFTKPRCSSTRSECGVAKLVWTRLRDSAYALVSALWV